ncbi:MAG: class I SAM-dependent methyltransferase [Oscillospiraceae bacterium]|nr:class I SAM-dependent methyltransferase [Oscillospiraceae bacterium]
MRIAENWKDFEVLDTTSGEKLERWGDVLLARPDPQIIWKTPKSKQWEKANARYHRSSSGGGQWQVKNMPKDSWTVNYGDLKFKISPTSFKHTGLFPEQAVNWDFVDKKIRNAGREIKVLNLFAYTGGATLAAANAGAKVTHVDASKGMVTWARENAKLSGLEDKPVRWIVDDCIKFVEREIRRGNLYDGIIMDPPSYGRGPGGEVWKLEEQVYDLVDLCKDVMSDNPLFFLLNSYTTGLSPSVMEYTIAMTVGKKYKGKVSSSEIGLPVKASGCVLPCGSTAIWESEK